MRAGRGLGAKHFNACLAIGGGIDRFQNRAATADHRIGNLLGLARRVDATDRQIRPDAIPLLVRRTRFIGIGWRQALASETRTRSRPISSMRTPEKSQVTSG